MKTSLPLTTAWKLMHAEPNLGPTLACSALPLEERWVDAQVPGDVHLDYLRAGLIADPFFGINHDKLRWMEEMDWWYRAEVTPPKVGEGQRLHLLFEGLDVFATIFLNGKEVGRHANMFTPLRIDVTDHVQAGANRLEVCLGAPLFPPDRPARQSDVRGYGQITRLQVRKSQSCYGWNISPRMVTTGIWKPVSWLTIMPGLRMDYGTAQNSRGEVTHNLLGFGPRVFFDVGEDSRASMDAAPPQVKFN